MALPKLKNFLCCIRLETGGLIIGWVSALTAVFTISYVATILSLASIEYNSNGRMNDPAIFTAYITLVVVFSIYLIYMFIVLISAVFLIKSTSRRDHRRMIPFMVLMAIGVFISFLKVLTIGLAGIIVAIISAGIEVYFFLCIYSLYDMFKTESLGTNNNDPIQMFPQPTPAQAYTDPRQTTSIVYTPQSVNYPQEMTTFNQQQEEPPMNYSQATQGYPVNDGLPQKPF